MGEAKKFGRYEVRDTIGRGAMGVVYLAEDPVIGRQVAIKVVESHEGLEDFELEQLNARFEREFQSAGSLSHPNIVSVHDVGLQDGNTFIAMEYVQGESLSSVLAANRAFSFKEIADMAAQLSSGLDYAHEFDIVHRDIKPANILITRDGRPKITDFGVAKVATTTLTRTGTVVGTPAYMSPEQVTGHPVAGTADQFSLAVMLYQMLTGERPFSGENPTTIMYKIVHEEPPPPSALNVTVPAAVDTALLRALAKNPVDRYPTCTDLANALRDALGAAPSAATMVMGAAAGEETVFDASIAQSHHLPAKDTDRRFSVGMLAAVAASVIVGALGVWAWSSGILGGGPVEPGEPARVEITLNLNIQAPPDLAIWVDGRDSGLVTPQALPLSGLEGESVVVELRYNGEVLVSQTVPLASDTADTWIPERIDAIVAEAVRGGDAVAAPGDEPTAEEPPAPVLFTITSSPAGAMVSFDNTPLGASPVQVEVDLSVGHSLRIEADGYDPLTWSFSEDTLTDDQRASQAFFFPLDSSVPPGFFVVDNRQYGYPVAVTVEPRGNTSGRTRTYEASVSHNIRLRPGNYRISLAAPGIFWENARNVSIDSEERENAALPRPLSVQIVANPGNCVISIDGHEVGPSPVTQLLASGQEYEFTFDWSAIGRGTQTKRERVRQPGQRIFGEAGQDVDRGRADPRTGQASR